MVTDAADGVTLQAGSGKGNITILTEIEAGSRLHAAGRALRITSAACVTPTGLMRTAAPPATFKLPPNVVLAAGANHTWEVSARLPDGRKYSNAGDFSLAAPDLRAQAVSVFAMVLGEQGRPQDAEAMAKAAIEIHKQIGSAPESRELAQTRCMLAVALVSQSRWSDAVDVYEEMRSGLAGNSALLRTLAHGDVNWSLALIRTTAQRKPS